ncbi:MAG: proline racemase family protein [Steroidobacteraceae bacterium]
MKRTVRVVDSHTGGEPTRVVVEGGPVLSGATVADMREDFRRNHDRFRSALANEPRGSEVIVGALLVAPSDPASTTGVIFFNNVGYLGMCGHGTIGVVTTLAHLGRLKRGRHRIETPVGPVHAELHGDGQVSVKNVASRRTAHGVRVSVPGHGEVVGDVAWGGNWFFLVERPRERIDLARVGALTQLTVAVREALQANGIRGDDGAEIDHVEISADSPTGADSRNFVLCPGLAYDRSPCGTGTSAKLACLHADGKLRPGAVWRQESVTGSVFSGSIEIEGGEVIPTIRGTAYVNAEATLILDARDPLCWGMSSS